MRKGWKEVKGRDGEYRFEGPNGAYVRIGATDDTTDEELDERILAAMDAAEGRTAPEED